MGYWRKYIELQQPIAKEENVPQQRTYARVPFGIDLSPALHRLRHVWNKHHCKTLAHINIIEFIHVPAPIFLFKKDAVNSVHLLLDFAGILSGRNCI